MKLDKFKHTTAVDTRTKIRIYVSQCVNTKYQFLVSKLDSALVDKTENPPKMATIDKSIATFCKPTCDSDRINKMAKLTIKTITYEIKPT